MGDETGDLVPEPFGGDDGNVLDDSRVGVEIVGETGVVFFYDPSGGFFDGFGSYSAHFLNLFKKI